MKIQRIDPPCDEIGVEDDEQVTLSDEWALVQTLQSWFLPMYITVMDQTVAEEYQLVQDMLFIADLALGLA